MDINWTTIGLIGAAGAMILIAKRHGAFGGTNATPTGVVRAGMGTKPAATNPVHFNPPVVRQWVFPCPQTGAELQREMAFAKLHHIALDPNSLPQSIKKKIDFVGAQTNTATLPITI